MAGAIAVAAVTSAAAVAVLRAPEDELGTLVAELVEAGAPGVIVLTREGDDLQTRAAGLADRDSGRPLRDDDRFRIGTVTKTFVATVVLQLVVEGRLGLEDTVERWLPGVVPGGERITIRQLLGHRSGLSITWTTLESSHRTRIAPVTCGSRGHSSTSLYHVRRRSLRASATRTRARLISCSSSSWRQRLGGSPIICRGASSCLSFLVPGRYMHGHRPPSHQGVVTGPPRDTSREAASWAWGAGAIVSTARDVDRFFTALLGGNLLSAAMLREMESADPAGSLRYGLGIAVFPTPCGDAWGHTGNAQGIVTVAWSRKEASRQIVVAVNVYPMSGELEGAVRRLQDAFCGSS